MNDPISDCTDAAKTGPGELGNPAGDRGAGGLVVALDAERLTRFGDCIPEKMCVLDVQKSTRFDCDWHGYTPYAFFGLPNTYKERKFQR